MKRRIGTFLLAMLMLLSLGTVAMAAEETDGLYLTADRQDDIITVLAGLADCEGVTNGRVEITYDPALVTFVSAAPAVRTWVSSVNAEKEGVVSFAWIASDLGAGENPVAELKFRLKDAAPVTYADFGAEVKELYNGVDPEEPTVKAAEVSFPAARSPLPTSTAGTDPTLKRHTGPDWSTVSARRCLHPRAP